MRIDELSPFPILQNCVVKAHTTCSHYLCIRTDQLLFIWQSLTSVGSFRRSISLLSSVEGIFSHDIGNGTRTLQDLVKLLQPLGLASYRGTDMHDIIRVGEGGSYQVFRCNHLKKQLVAAKIMRIPLEKSAEEKADFRRRVFCLIKDLEVMHHPPLAQHPNILGLLGYGWNLAETSALPFLVTEYAERGTLRDFLRNVPTSILSKLTLCGNIASGLHAMHRCGVAHGDLKLENVLVFGKIHEPDIEVTHYSAKVVSRFLIILPRFSLHVLILCKVRLWKLVFDIFGPRLWLAAVI